MTTSPSSDRPLRSDAERNRKRILEAAAQVFAERGLDVPLDDIAVAAGVGVGTVYRHFPQRSDLIVAVLHREMDAVAEAGATLAAQHEPGEALAKWLDRYIDFLATKPGFAAALHSGDPAFEALPGHFRQRVGPPLAKLLEAAAATGEIRADLSADDLLTAVALLCQPTRGGGVEYGRRTVAVLIDGLRYRAEHNGS